jgi:cytochrome P450
MPGGARVWAVTRYEQVRALLADPRLSSDIRKPGFPSLREVDEPSNADATRSLIEMDDPDHKHYRRMLIPEFTARRIRTLRTQLQRHVDDHVDELVVKGPPADLVSGFALPIPSLMICDLIGVPFSDHDFFQSRTSALLEITSTPEEVAQAFGEFYAYLVELIERKQAAPSDDLIGRLLTERVAAHELTVEELISTLLLLLLAGHETTANMISLGIFTLLRNPDQLARLRAEPELLPGAVEEMLRLHSIGDVATFRVAAVDIQIGDRVIKAGDGVVPLVGAANHDETVFRDPSRFDITRHARHHVAFGYGPHQCIAQNLARATLEVCYGTLITRMPTLELAVDADSVAFKYDANTFGINELPVRW